MKKFRTKIALILVLSLTLAVAIPALAAGQSTKITGKYEETTIEVVIPTTATAVINPYKFGVPIYADDGETRLGAIGEGEEVVTRPLIGYNMSEFDLKVGATVVGTEKGALTLGTTADSGKRVQIDFEIKQNDYETGFDGWYYTVDAAEKKSKEVIGQFNGKYVVAALNKTWSDKKFVTVKNANDAPNGVELAADDGIKLAKAEEKKVGTQMELQPKPASIFFARLTGDVATHPVIEGQKVEWDKKDGVDVTIAWTIEADVS